jgi:hypothetical protein
LRYDSPKTDKEEKIKIVKHIQAYNLRYKIDHKPYHAGFE